MLTSCSALPFVFDASPPALRTCLPVLVIAGPLAALIGEGGANFLGGGGGWLGLDMTLVCAARALFFSVFKVLSIGGLKKNMFKSNKYCTNDITLIIYGYHVVI